VHVNPIMFEVPHHQFHIKEWAENKERILSGLTVKQPENVPEEALAAKDTPLSNFWDDFDVNDWTDFLDLVAPYLQDIPRMHEITKAWFQTYKQYEYHSAHTHGAYGWSAIFYADYDHEVHVPTKFYSPFANIGGMVEDFSPDVKEGDLIVFPSMVLHESPINLSEKERTVISFNVV